MDQILHVLFLLDYLALKMQPYRRASYRLKLVKLCLGDRYQANHVYPLPVVYFRYGHCGSLRSWASPLKICATLVGPH